ncbi:hypothetical protein M758_4G005400 [Ceratodon purpureus]|uniref:Uncharacterized protein n=1 Tax=Ceratodon purpureus TaxID=3225 RepID=A0A8T0I5D5_CERPU|nr:hypothetical protein KC19_4G005900 [Ceratodon purpureus]KAG0617654.1 hypothetical protein M758_4G005400 [Ceratodon purpureus]
MAMSGRFKVFLAGRDLQLRFNFRVGVEHSPESKLKWQNCRSGGLVGAVVERQAINSAWQMRT